jgi:carbamate kinase
MEKLAVVALGGNALLRDNEEGTIEQQEQNATDTVENLIHLIKDGYELVITHGNGPQVGNILMRNDAGEKMYHIAPMPLDICVADSQGGIGYMIERIIRNVLNKHGIKKNVITMVTLVEVDQNDPAFQNPSKRIGKTYSKAEADKLSRERNWAFKSSSKSADGFRRVVPSPAPLEIINRETIELLVNNGNIVIAAGGGGIPVYYDDEGNVRTIDAVIDKDRASGLLAKNIGADELYILTDVPFIYKDYGQPTQEKLEFLNYADTLKYLEMGTFAEGSMEPKIRACLEFIKNGGQKSVITEAKKLEDKTFGSKITMEYDERDKSRKLEVGSGKTGQKTKQMTDDQ